MCPERSTPVNTLIIDSPEIAGATEPTLIEQLDQKTAEYLDYSKRIKVFSALEPEFVQEFIDVVGAGAVTEALSRMYTDHFLAEPVGFTAFMRKVLAVRGDTGSQAISQLSGQLVGAFQWSLNKYNGGGAPIDIDANMRATKERAYTPLKLEKLESELASAAPKLGRPEWVSAMGQMAVVLSEGEFDMDNMETNGFEDMRFEFNQGTFESDLSANGNDLIASRLCCAEGQLRVEGEIEGLVSSEKERIDSEVEQARLVCIDTVKKGLGDDFTVCWNTTDDSLKVERITEVSPTDFKDGVSQSEVDTVIMPAMLIYSHALLRYTSDRLALKMHDKLSRLRFIESVSSQARY